jgi:hypothetical protein
VHGQIVECGMRLLVALERMGVRPEVGIAFQKAIVGVKLVDPPEEMDSKHWDDERASFYGQNGSRKEVAQNAGPGPSIYDIGDDCLACDGSGVAYWCDDVWGDCFECGAADRHPWVTAWKSVAEAVEIAKTLVSDAAR